MAMNNLEQTILRNIITNEKYMRKVLPFIQNNYFEGNYRLVFKELCKYVAKYNRLPTQEAFEIELSETNIAEDRFVEIAQIVPHIFSKEDNDEQWLLDRTEQWIQDRAIHIAILDSINIIDGKHETLTKGAIPELLTKALGAGFDSNIGHDYFADAERRYEFYHEDEERIPFDLDYFNRITKGGLVNKSLSIILAGTGVGKSLAMCHMAAANLLDGRDVLYITMEMSEEKIAERIDANLLDVNIQDIEDLSKDNFMDRVGTLRAKTTGKLIVKEYPTGQANASHFRALLNDLKLKKQFEPDIIYVDYLNICASARLKNMGGAINSYTYVKAIAEEIRGLGVEFDLPVVSATQTTRSGYANSDPGLEDTSESFGLPATADMLVALISSEELEAEGKILVKQLKNRYNDLNTYKRFVIGVDRSKMRLFDVDDGGDMLTNQDVPIMDHNHDDRFDGISEAAKEMRF